MTASIVGVDVGGTTTRAVGFDGDLVAVGAVAAPTPRGVTAIVAQVTRLVGDIHGAPTAVAVGMPGRVDHARGVVSSAVNLGIDGPIDIASLLSDAVGAPVHLENDVNAAALGAFANLGLSPAQSLAYVNVGTGIAAGFVPAGRLWRGSIGGAGEIGHVPMRSGEPACRCGQVGCAEAVGSGSAITVTDDANRRHDVIAATAWAVQLCVMTLDVDVVAVGGGMTRPTDAFGSDLINVLNASEATSPMLADLGLARRVVLPPADAALGSLGAVLAMRHDGVMSG
jgi:predicted NBD/HSP70 family sugar kinase